MNDPARGEAFQQSWMEKAETNWKLKNSSREALQKSAAQRALQKMLPNAENPKKDGEKFGQELDMS